MGSPLKDNCAVEAIEESFDLWTEPPKAWTKEEEGLGGVPAKNIA